MPVEIREFDRLGSSEEEYRAWNRCSNLIQREAWPDDPPVSVERTMRSLRHTPTFVELRTWAAWSSDQPAAVVAQAGCDMTRTSTNQHQAGLFIRVLPEFRRQGIATQLLRHVAETVRGWDRRLLFTVTSNRAPAGDAFMRALGARAAHEEWTNQLDLRDLDPNLLHAWQAAARERASGLQLGSWDGPYPEECLEQVAAMKEAVNLMPHGDLEREDEHVTPAELRDRDACRAAHGDVRWTIYAFDPFAGRIAGYTEVWWHPDQPEILIQDDTAVFTEYQNRGIGRWLKAAMLERVVRERPEVKWVRTWNAHTNAPMLKINHELGFRPYRSETAWQVELEKVEAYLAERS